ncbi:hypothetical protein ACFOZY_03655 [Chungangia koreensis]|uniref:Uncharacterized protein n=1 Tax=Chungangia koreensis TaxID=752657 RepID=A0ABV8X251_9LACT
MPVTQWFILKSLTIPSSWIALLAAFIITGLIVWKRYGKQAENMYSDIVIIFIVVWKLSVVVTDFNMVVDSPLMILYFNGGQTGIYLGVVAALIRTFFALKKNGFSVKDTEIALFSIILIQCIYQVLMVFLNDGTNWQGMLTFTIFTIISFAVLLYISKGTLWRIQLATIMLLVMLLIGTIQPEGMNQTPILTTIVCMLAIFPILFKQVKQKPTEERI